MEGIPIGRKLNLLAHDGYHELVNTLEQMFDTTILCNCHIPSYFIYIFYYMFCVAFLISSDSKITMELIFEQGGLRWTGCNQRDAMC